MHLNRRKFVFKPVNAYWFKNASTLNGSVFINSRIRLRQRNIYLQNQLSLLPTAPYEQLDEVALSGGPASATWFGHWLVDDLPLQILAQKYSTTITLRRKFGYHEPYYHDILSIPLPRKVQTALIKKLIVIDEFAQNPIKTKRYHYIRNIFKRHKTGYDRIFLARGKTGSKRFLINEKDLIYCLKKEGFVTIYIDQISFDDLVKACRGASVIVSVEGSHLTHALYLMKDYGTIIILNPPYRVLTTIADIGVFCGLHSGMFICEPSSESPMEFIVNTEEVKRFIEDTISVSKRNTQKLKRFVKNILSEADNYSL
jgi:hypothetical protein